MTCSALDLTGCFGMAWSHLLGMLPWWLPWIGWGLLALVALWAFSKVADVLARVKEVLGTPGIVGVGALVVYLVGYFRGSRHDGVVPHEHVDASSPDALPSVTVPPRPVPRPVRPPDALPPKSLTER